MTNINTFESEIVESVASSLPADVRASFEANYSKQSAESPAVPTPPVVQTMATAQPVVATAQPVVATAQPVVATAQPVVKLKRFINRQKTSDGRSASQYIRDLDVERPGLSANEVVELALSIGITIAPALVYNVRQNLKKKNGEMSTASSPEEVKAKRQAAAAKARAVRAAKRLEREKAKSSGEVVQEGVVSSVPVVEETHVIEVVASSEIVEETISPDLVIVEDVAEVTLETIDESW